jgi:hypothetical protein
MSEAIQRFEGAYAMFNLDLRSAYFLTRMDAKIT